jgi:limonene-1,2-epoxide hydrolase
VTSFDEYFTSETVWENVGLITTVGVEGASLSESVLA